MAYRALYREWRPKDFSHVVGQDTIISTLRNQVMTRRIAHAYLFCGSRGTGKTSTAKILAKAINCLNPVNGDPCGECENCQRAERDETLDVIEIDAASNNGVDEMRDLRDSVKYPPQYGLYKVYIIDEVHMLSTSAFNALLKTLEEPPAHIVFILATTEPQKLPETILSRCQRFDFGRIPMTEIIRRLKEAADGSGAAVSDGALMLIARAAEGGMRDALSILDMCLGYREQVDEALVRSILGTSDASFLFEFCDALAECNSGKVFLLVDQIMREGKDPAVFAKDVSAHLRALLIAKTSPDDMARVMDMTGEEAADFVRQADGITLSRLMRMLDLFMSLETEMRYASTPRFALENTSMKCCLRLEGTDEQSLLDRIAELEQKVDALSKSGAVHVQGAGKPAGPQKEGGDSRKSADRQAGSNGKNADVVPAAKVSTDDLTIWKELMSRIQKTDIAAWSFLSQGSIVSSKNGQFCWQANQKEGEGQYIQALNKADRNSIICRLLSEISGMNCTFTAAEKGAAIKTDKNESQYLEQLYETFGKGSVDTVDQLT